MDFPGSNLQSSLERRRNSEHEQSTTIEAGSHSDLGMNISATEPWDRQPETPSQELCECYVQSKIGDDDTAHVIDEERYEIFHGQCTRCEESRHPVKPLCRGCQHLRLRHLINCIDEGRLFRVKFGGLSCTFCNLMAGALFDNEPSYLSDAKLMNELFTICFHRLQGAYRKICVKWENRFHGCSSSLWLCDENGKYVSKNSSSPLGVD